MQSKPDSMNRAQWLRRSPFEHLLMQVNDLPMRNVQLAKVWYEDGEVKIRVAHMKNANYESMVRNWCDTRAEKMKQDIAAYVAKKLV